MRNKYGNYNFYKSNRILIFLKSPCNTMVSTPSRWINIRQLLYNLSWISPLNNKNNVCFLEAFTLPLFDKYNFYWHTKLRLTRTHFLVPSILFPFSTAHICLCFWRLATDFPTLSLFTFITISSLITLQLKCSHNTGNIILEENGIIPRCSESRYQKRKEEEDVIMKKRISEMGILEGFCLALKMVEGAMSQGRWAASRRWKRQEKRFSRISSLQKGIIPLILAQWDTCWTSDGQNCKKTNLYCFKPLSLWFFVRASVGS